MPSSIEEPSIIVMRLNIGCSSMATRLCARMSMSTPMTRPSPPSSSSIEEVKMSEPPWAMPVSTITSGFVLQMISWSAMTSCGHWITGRPSHVKL